MKISFLQLSLQLLLFFLAAQHRLILMSSGKAIRV